jgi:hypothetical protein
MTEHIPECSICLMTIKYGNPAWKVQALDCGHCFHRRCILHWGKECPECRAGCKMLDLVTVNCEIHTTKYRRCFTIKVIRSDTFDTIYSFIRELTKISQRHIKMKTIEIKNNSFSITNDPPRSDEAIQSYIDRRNNILNKLMGFSVLYNMTIHFDMISEMAHKIDANPLRYKFSDPKDVYISIELDESLEESIDDEHDLLETAGDQMCICVLL